MGTNHTLPMGVEQAERIAAEQHAAERRVLDEAGAPSAPVAGFLSQTISVTVTDREMNIGQILDVMGPLVADGWAVRMAWVRDEQRNIMGIRFHGVRFP
jgi:hypothetical protein